MQNNAKILIVDDERVALKNLEHVMKKEGYDVTATQSGANALKLLDERTFDVVLTDLRMEKVDGLQVLQRSRELHPDTEVIMITGYATLQSAVDAMKHGAFYYIAKPFKLDEVRKVVQEAAHKVSLKKENRHLREQLDSYQGKVKIISQDPAMQKLLDMARQVAPVDTNVLISGESGTGKELFARYLHVSSSRAAGPFFAINCGAFNEELLSSELFGYEKGAFTGAAAQKKGLIEMASAGTLFLDEVTEMTPAMQVKLLRVIQERELLRVGGIEPIKMNVRIVAATNRDVLEAVRTGAFRQDLYFRLNVVTLKLPALAARKADIPLLCASFLHRYSALMGKEVEAVAPEALDLLMAYDFPGNVRELENLIERGVAVATSGRIEAAHLPEEVRGAGAPAPRGRDGTILTLEEMERNYIRWVLDELGGNQQAAAQRLGIDRVTLWRKLKRYALE